LLQCNFTVIIKKFYILQVRLAVLKKISFDNQNGTSRKDDTFEYSDTKPEATKCYTNGNNKINMLTNNFTHANTLHDVVRHLK
jgi:hypothetical protein